jgi:hypothetical protein
MSRRWVLALALVVGRRDAAGQTADDTWLVTPARPTVGDTVWLERRFPLPAGWRLRPGRLESGDEVESLSDPIARRSGDAWIVRYPVAAWTPGEHVLTIPPVWRLGPDAQADSVLGGTAKIQVQRVIPDSATGPVPKPALDPLRADRRDPRPVVLAAVAAVASLAAALWWRRRPPRRLPAPAMSPRKPDIADTRWINAGEARAVAARASGRLRIALAAAVPEAHLGLSTVECIAAAQRARPQAFPDLATVLGALDEVAFATGSETDVGRLADRANALAGALGQ